MTAASAVCESCGTEPRDGARFCDACGAPINAGREPAEYKQVTVLFADVVRSMDIAVAVGAERFRFNCGKAQPGQVAAVSHGCPSALFRGINVLNTRTEAGR